MRKLKLQMQVTLDGYVCGPHDEMDFLVWNWDEELKKYVIGLTAPVDLVVLGRKLAEGFIPSWKGMAADPETADIYTRQMNERQKVVFTQSMDSHEWENTTLAQGDLVDEIRNLKAQTGGDIIAYGGVDFVSDLILHDLVDDYFFFVNPVSIGAGRNVFKTLDKKKDLKLKEAVPFSCGIVALHYTK